MTWLLCYLCKFTSFFLKLLAPINVRHTDARIDRCHKWLIVFVIRDNWYWWIESAKTSALLKISAFCTALVFHFINFTLSLFKIRHFKTLSFIHQSSSPSGFTTMLFSCSISLSVMNSFGSFFDQAFES